ncbi:MAG: YraN family protein [Oceanococcus sp.]
MNTRGAKAELRARRYLESQGLQCLEQNMQCRVGEIDLIMCDGDELAFVEVRSRAEHATVDALSSISVQKRLRIVRASRHWLSRHPDWFERPMRFDVVAIDGNELQWLRNSFDAE